MTKFFDVINVSATHIYHSALELCPLSSILRKLYYHRRINRSPKVVVGTPDSWDQAIAVSRKDHHYGPCTWSPCGRFVATQMTETVEIRNQLTLEPITILQRTETVPYLNGPFAYSPDGRSIACASNLSIIIWDIQTGGVATEIKSGANESLVWSSDGGTLCAIHSENKATFTVHTHAISSGTTSSPDTFKSGSNPHLWTDDESFWIMTTSMEGEYRTRSIDILKVGSTQVQSFSFGLLDGKIGSFSPATRRISISSGHRLRILDIRGPGPGNCLLDKTGDFFFHCFSSDGSLFAAPQQSTVHIWKYDSGYYVLRWGLRCQGLLNSPLRFSPTLSSILGNSRDILQVWRLHELPTTSETYRQQCVGLSRSGTRVATAYKGESTITISDLLAQTPPQFIDTDMAIDGMVLTCNVLLVVDSEKLVAWLLTEEGLVDDVIGDGRVGRSDRIWTISQPWQSLAFQVEGQVGAIRYNGIFLHLRYHTETGDVLHSTQAPSYHSIFRWHSLTGTFRGRDYLRHYDFSQCSIPPKDRWQTSRSTLQEGWVKDSEGKRRLWVPVEWRAEWDLEDWCDNITTQFSHLGGRSVLIKF